MYLNIEYMRDHARLYGFEIKQPIAKKLNSLTVHSTRLSFIDSRENGILYHMGTRFSQEIELGPRDPACQ